METLLTILWTLVVLLVVAITCMGYLLLPALLICVFVTICEGKGWADEAPLYAACVGAFLGAATLFALATSGGPPAGPEALLVASVPLAQGTALGAIVGLFAVKTVTWVAKLRRRANSRR